MKYWCTLHDCWVSSCDSCSSGKSIDGEENGAFSHPVKCYECVHFDEDSSQS